MKLPPHRDGAGGAETAVSLAVDDMTRTVHGPEVGLARVIVDHPAAVLLVDLDAAQVVYANTLASQLAPSVTLPIGVAEWSEYAGLRNAAGHSLEGSTTPLERVAGGEPVHGELVTALRRSDITRAREDLWVIGTPLTDAPEPLGRRALVVFLPLRHDAAVREARAAGEDLRHRAVIASDLAFSISDPNAEDDPLVWVNPAFERATGYVAADVVGRNCRFLQGPLTDPAAVQRIRDGLKGGGTVNETLLNYRADGTAFWNHLVISPIFDADGNLTHHVGVQSDVTDRVDADAARDAALLLAQAASARQRAVSAISQELAAHIADPGDLLAAIPGIVASHFHGWSHVVTLDGSRVLDTAVAYGPPRRNQAHATVASSTASEIEERDPAQAEAALHRFLEGPGAALLAAAAGTQPRQWPVVMSLTADELEGLTPDKSPVPGLSSVRAGRSIVAAPMMARGKVTGLLLISRAGDGQFDDADEVAAIADIGLRAGTALDNARLYAQEHQAAITLQRSLLPTLPTLDSFDVAAAYIPAAAAEVGGDWYDVLDLPGPWIGIAVGDVMGHDMAAAAAMGQLRSMVRTLAWAGHRPADLITQLDELVQGLRATTMATLLYAFLDDPAEHEGACHISYTSAGHPPALLRHPDGTVERLEQARTSPVGVFDRRDVTQAHAMLPEGGALVLYTDGLIERPALDIDDQIDKLAAVLAATELGASAAQVRSSITDALMSADHSDDTCVLVITRPLQR